MEVLAHVLLISFITSRNIDALPYLWLDPAPEEFLHSLSHESFQAEEHEDT